MRVFSPILHWGCVSRAPCLASSCHSRRAQAIPVCPASVSQTLKHTLCFSMGIPHLAFWQLQFIAKKSVSLEQQLLSYTCSDIMDDETALIQHTAQSCAERAKRNTWPGQKRNTLNASLHRCKKKKTRRKPDLNMFVIHIHSSGQHIPLFAHISY